MVSTQTQKPIQRIVIEDPLYPLQLLDLEYVPGHLWCRGELRESDRVSVAVIGSRRCSDRGRETANRLAVQLARVGVTVISGLALGIDGAAHRGALSVGGRTLAVVGTGLHHLDPPEHRELAEEIENSGALISSFSPDYPGSKSGRNVLQQNYILSGMSQLLVVVEEETHGGTVSAVQGALGQGRSVGLCAGLVESRDWARALVEQGLAFIVESVEDILRRVEF